MLKSYASYFSSYLLDNIRDVGLIERIILFGSVARDEADKDSDVDIFIELRKETSKTKKEIEKIIADFYKSREALLFKTKGVENRINAIIGRLDAWNQIKETIENTGILLYGSFVPTDISGKKHVLIFWNKIKKNRGAFLNKIYGFKIKEKRYSGLIEKLGGIRCGKSSFIIPIENKNEMIKLLKKYGVDAQIMEIWK